MWLIEEMDSDTLDQVAWIDVPWVEQLGHFHL